jgi:hypothetical protein
MSDVASTSSPSLLRLERRIRGLAALAFGSLLVGGGALALALTVALRAPAPVAAATKLDELTVGRLNVVEPDGTPRMIVASRARFPGSFLRGKEIPRPDRRDTAGILFVDDEGTENGGLVQNGALDKDGKVVAGLSLTFDRFRQDQVLQLALDDGDDRASAGMIVVDRPSYKVFSMEDMFRVIEDTRRLAPAAREAVFQQHEAMGHLGHRRGYFGTARGSAKLVLHDPQGRPRLTLSVSEQGEPSIELLDEAGHAVRTIDARTP